MAPILTSCDLVKSCSASPANPGFSPVDHDARTSSAPGTAKAVTAADLRSSVFRAWSASDDVKYLSDKAQEKTGKVEMYSGKYYASCVAGGLIACVSPQQFNCQPHVVQYRY